MQFLTDLGNIITRQDSVSQSVAAQNLATAEYLRGAAQNDPEVDNSGDNKILMYAIVGSLLVAGTIGTVYLIKKGKK